MKLDNIEKEFELQHFDEIRKKIKSDCSEVTYQFRKKRVIKFLKSLSENNGYEEGINILKNLHFHNRSEFQDYVICSLVEENIDALLYDKGKKGSSNHAIINSLNEMMTEYPTFSYKVPFVNKLEKKYDSLKKKHKKIRPTLIKIAISSIEAIYVYYRRNFLKILSKLKIDAPKFTNSKKYSINTNLIFIDDIVGTGSSFMEVYKDYTKIYNGNVIIICDTIFSDTFNEFSNKKKFPNIYIKCLKIMDEYKFITSEIKNLEEKSKKKSKNRFNLGMYYSFNFLSPNNNLSILFESVIPTHKPLLFRDQNKYTFELQKYISKYGNSKVDTIYKVEFTLKGI